MGLTGGFFTNLFASKPKSKAERYGLKGGVRVVNNPPPDNNRTPGPGPVQEPEHPEDQDLFEGGGHGSIPVRLSDDELGPLPPIPFEVSGSIVESVKELDILPGIQEVRTLIKQVLDRIQGDSKIKTEINVLMSDCDTLFGLMEKLNSTSPEINSEVTRMRKELTHTLAHLDHYGTTQLARARNRLAVLERTARCRVAYERIQQKFLLIQGAEILNVQREMLVQQMKPPSSELQGEIQASEEELQRIIRQHTGRNLLPEMILYERIKYRGYRSYSDGKRFKVHQGELINGEKVAIKISEQKPGLHDDEGRNFGRRIRRHATTWKSLDSKYILPFLGMGVEIVEAREGSMRDYFRLYFVSPWMPDGDAVNFIRNAHDQGLYVDVAKIVRDVALGLKYLHELDEPCIHGSVRGENVLIRRDQGVEQGCLNGFALTKREARNQPPPELTSEDGVCRWKAPEILDSVSDRPLLELSSDIWSWAMTALQLYSGQVPYHQFETNFRICTEITSGRALKRADYPDFDKYAPLPDKTWALLERCWNIIPEERPTIQKVTEELDQINTEAGLA
ncbi:Tousled-like kinase [Rhizoctonia solani]|uniref:Tousled-like kinase n=1 Tax=Rhizoctonia solani TaxID=456999 RepID=A0A0K6GFU9_9AGAM|nr:Tousled-like kinase [Rhizoctonia solani]